MLRAPLVGALVLAISPLAAPTAVATDDPVHLAPGIGGGSRDVILHPRDPGSNGAGSGGGGRGTGARSPVNRTCTHMGEEVDCTSSWGVWSDALRCWVQRMSPQPPADESIWAGRTDGAIYWCQPPSVPGSIGGGHMFWAPSSGVGAVDLVDPVTLAEEAIDAMNLSAITAGITPPQGPDTYTLVGIPTWMWVEDPSARTWGPMTRNASAGSVTVNATARATKVVWDMGDGTVVSCGKGTAYVPSFGAAPSPNCGHRYEAPGRYQVTATSHWDVDWTGGGQAGTIRFTLTRDASIWVREAHGLISEQG